MDSRFKEWVYIEGLMQSAYHEAALKMNLSDSEFWMEKKGTVSRTSVVMSTSAGYILFLVLFAVGRSFWFMLLVFLLAGLMRTIKEPVLAAWMNDQVDEKMRATVFSTSGQLDSFGQIIGGPIVGLVAQQVSIPWGLVCTAFLLLPALFLVPVAGKKRD